MNTPKDEMITEALHCMIEQRKHEIWEVLYPLSIKYGFTLDSDYASIKLEPPCKDFPEEKCGCKIPLDSVYSAFVKGDFLYVMCRWKVYFILDLESGLWRLYLPMHRPPRLKVLWWRIHETTRDLVLLVSHWKDCSISRHSHTSSTRANSQPENCITMQCSVVLWHINCTLGPSA